MTLVEVVVALLLVAITLLAAGHATASALRLGHHGLAEARVAAALGTEAARLDVSAHAGVPCSALVAGSSQEGPVSLRWRGDHGHDSGVVWLAAELRAGARRVADSVGLRLACP